MRPSFFLLLFLLILPSCKTAERQTYLPPGTYTTANEKLEIIRKKNFSVLRTEMALKGLSMDSPMLVRAFKTEMKLELWVQSIYTKQYELFKSYDVCSKSGTLGPKLKEGDLQTPEGFYNVTAKRLNPNSQYFLSFNIGYPNAYDRAQKRTGSLLMIHGACASKGCLAMTDESIGEIYLMIEQNFKYGHKSVPIHIYPFRMTDENMLVRNLSRWYPFWANLKEGYDHFEKYRTPADVGVSGNQYVFNQGDYY